MTENTTIGIELKKKNRNNIYKLLQQEKCITKQDIVNRLKLSLPTVTQNLMEMQEEGLVQQKGSFGNTGGRRAQGYSIIADARVAIGVDLNNKHIAVVAIDLEGNILDHIRIHCRFEKNSNYYKKVGDLVEQMIEKCKLDKKQILGVGISIQGVIDQDQKTVIYGPILDITGEYLANIAEFIPYPCALFHDADAAAFAEIWISPQLRNAVYLSLSTNLGGSVIIDRKIYAGDKNYGGKIEHMTLVPDGLPCYCGEVGCAEAYCSANVLTENTEDGLLATFFKKLGEGSKEHMEIWHRYVKYLSIVLNNIRTLFGCEVIIGGYMGEYLECHMDEIKELTYMRNSFSKSDDYLRLCSFRIEAIASGAALQFIDDFINQI
jgi:predicted NBD/HSP70 family sugar kinase